MVEVFNLILQLKNIKKEKLYLSQRDQIKLIKFYFLNKRKHGFKSYIKFLNYVILFMIDNLKSLDETIEHIKNKNE